MREAHRGWRAGLGLVLWLAVTFAAAALGSRFLPGPWYARLIKPPWTPPSWVFAPVWTALYILMAVAAWRVWKAAGFGRARAPLLLFFLQLVLNAAWSWLFFGLQRIDLALLDIAVLLLTISATLRLFWTHDRPSAVLFAPYVLWVAYATTLNAAIWRLNGGG